jgi:hypothetical protein
MEKEKVSAPKRRTDITITTATKPLLPSLSIINDKQWHRMWLLPIDIQLMIFDHNTPFEISSVHRACTKSRQFIERYWAHARHITIISSRPSFITIMGHYQRVRSITIPPNSKLYYSYRHETPHVVDALSSLITRNIASITSVDSPFTLLQPSILNQLSLCASLTSLSIPDTNRKYDEVLPKLVRSCSLLTDLRLIFFNPSRSTAQWVLDQKRSIGLMEVGRALFNIYRAYSLSLGMLLFDNGNRSTMAFLRITSCINHH